MKEDDPAKDGDGDHSMQITNIDDIEEEFL
jgi:hypothetical protein